MKLRLLGFAVASCFLVSCGDDSSEIGSGVDAVKSVLSYLNTTDALLPDPSSSRSSGAVHSSLRSAFGTAWDSTGALAMGHPRYDGTSACSAYNVNVSFKDWMGYQFDDSAERCNGSSINIFGRVKQSLGTFCAVSYFVGGATSSSAIAAGTQSITFTAAAKTAIESACGVAVGSIPDDTVGSMTVSHPTGVFDTKIALTISGRQTMEFYMSYSASSAKIATNENNSNGTQRVLVSLDTSTRKLLAEYVSRNTSGGVYIHRLYSDAATDTARVISQESGASSEYRRYTVTGMPNSTSETDVAVAADFNGSITTPSYTANFDRQACVNKSTGAVSTDGPTISSGSFTCGGVTGATVDSATAFATVTTATASSGWQTLTENTELSWSSMSDMLTGGL